MNPMKRPSKDPEKTAIYEAKTPEPNYEEFGEIGADFIDFKHREYILATSEHQIVSKYARVGDIKFPDYTEPSLTKSEGVGTQIFWIRIPTHLRGTVDFPEPEDEWITMYFHRNQILCKGRTDGVYVSGPKKKTGFVILRNFQSSGQVLDPSKYEYLVDKRKRIKRDKAPLF